MRIQPRTIIRRRGAALAETAIVMPFLFTILFGVWEVGRLVNVSQMVANAAREGARLSVTGLYSSSNVSTLATTNVVTTFNGPYFQVQTAVANYLTNSGLPMSSASSNLPIYVTVTNETRNYTVQCKITPGSSGSTTGPTITLSGAAPTVDPTTDTTVLQYDTLRVDVQYPFAFARWSPNNLYFYMGSSPVIYATQRWPCMRDQPIVVDTTIPNQPLP